MSHSGSVWSVSNMAKTVARQYLQHIVNDSDKRNFGFHYCNLLLDLVLMYLLPCQSCAYGWLLITIRTKSTGNKFFSDGAGNSIQIVPFFFEKLQTISPLFVILKANFCKHYITKSCLLKVMSEER